MKKLILAGCLVLAVSAAAFGQKARPEMMAEAVELTDGRVCGEPKFTKSETIIGTVVKRHFADDELTLDGVVIREAKDQRQFVNIDAEYLQTQTGNLSANLSSLLVVGAHVRIKADVCGRIYVMRTMKRVRF